MATQTEAKEPEGEGQDEAPTPAGPDGNGEASAHAAADEAEERSAEAEGTPAEAKEAKARAAEAEGQGKPAEAGKAAPERMSAGARLAARKAAKAARKASQRGRDAEVRESEVIKRAAHASAWARKNRGLLVGIVVGVIAAAGGAFYFQRQAEAKAQAASDRLWEATRTATAPIVPEGEMGFETADQTFSTQKARADEAIERYDQVIKAYPGSEAALWAELGRAAAMLDADEADNAAKAYERARKAAMDDPIARERALEGLGFANEAKERWAEARKHFASIKDTGVPGAESLANYHLARMWIREGDETKAKELLRSVVEALKAEDAAELPYVRGQAEQLLGQLDPSSRPAASPQNFMQMGGGGAEPSQAEIQKILERLKAQKKGGE